MNEPCQRRVRAPIIIVGSPRSGTTLLGSLLAAHARVAYWEEPRTIWSQGNAWRDDDVLDETDLSPVIGNRIDSRFADFLASSGRQRFAEKTPGNTLRLRFIHALYPDSKIIHLIRDGRAVVASMLRMLEMPPDRTRISARLRETPLREIPAQLPLLFRHLAGRMLHGGQRAYWGPRPPGWRNWLNLPKPVMLARQWRCLVESAQRDVELFPSEQVLQIRYEDLVSEPATWLEKIRRVCELQPDEAAFGTGALQRISNGRVDAWRSDLDSAAIELIDDEVGELLAALGY